MRAIYSRPLGVPLPINRQWYPGVLPLLPQTYGVNLPLGTAHIDKHGLDRERSRAALMRALDQRGSDKHQTPDPGQKEGARTRLLEGFSQFPLPTPRLRLSLEGETGGGVAGVKAPGLLEELRSA